MMPLIQGVILTLENSLAVSLVVKATFVMALAMVVELVPAHRSRASLRHTLLAAAFAVLPALPVAAILAPPLRILVSAPHPKRTAPLPSAAMPDVRVAPAQIMSPAGPRAAGFSMADWLSAAWLFGVMLFLLPLALGLKQARSLRRTAIPWQFGQSIAEGLARDAGIHRRVEVLLHERISGPTTYGAMKPVVLLPVDAQIWDAEDLNRALVHELEHVWRGDWMSHCLARVVCAVYWFHPLIWMVWRQFALDAERACDDAVLGRTEPTAYADQLVGLARRLSALRKSPGLAMANRADLSARVGALLDGRQQRGRAGVFSVALAWMAAAMLVVAVSPLAIVAAPQAAAPPLAAIPVQVSLPIAMPPIALAQLAAPPIPAPAAGVTSMKRFSANTSLIIVDVSIKDQDGKAIEGFGANDFAITEDGKAQSIWLFEFQKLLDSAGAQSSAVSSYYVLGYYTTNSRLDGSYRQIRVALKNNPAAKLDYRAGYYGSRVADLGSPDAGGANGTISSDITGPTVLSKVDPEYSEEARKAKYSGTVWLRIDVDTLGQVTRVVVTRSLGMGLDEKAMEAVTKWKFRPAMKDGKPVDAQSEVSVNFRLL
jgi:TonB family protein